MKNSSKGKIFEIQPESCRLQLAPKKIEYTDWVKENHPEYIVRWERVLFLDPTPYYERIHQFVDPHKRVNSFGIDKLFPNLGDRCACGCGQGLTGRRVRWATDMCRGFAFDIYSIICNIHQIPGKYITRYCGDKCMECNEADGEELDHIIGVKHGGGACWLSNYRWLCKGCHRKKTNTDFGFKSKKKATPKNSLDPPF